LLAPSLKGNFEDILKPPGPGESIFELGRDENLAYTKMHLSLIFIYFIAFLMTFVD
jgi:hypothetical protein